MVGWPKWMKREDRREEEQVPAVKVPRVHFTETARQTVLHLLEQKGVLERGALRITAAPGPSGPSYNMALEEGEPNPGDLVLDGGGFRVLLDPGSAPLVDGATVEFMNDPLRPGFKIEPPSPTLLPVLDAPTAARPRARPQLDLSDPVVATVQDVIDRQINPGIAGHGGRATLIDVKDDVVYVELGGGCQGCSMAAVTLKQGVEQMIRRAVPQVRQVVDVTDHAGGSNPYFSSEKGGASPFHQAAKS